MKEEDIQDILENLQLLAEAKTSSSYVARTCERALFAIIDLHKQLLHLSQVTGELCSLCGWAMKFPDEPCRCELAIRLGEKS